MPADSIRVDLFHMRDEMDTESKILQTDSEIKDALVMNKKGFRWKTLLNDKNGRRQVMQMSKPKD